MADLLFQAQITACPNCGSVLILDEKDGAGLLVGRCRKCGAEFQKSPEERKPRELKRA